MSEDIKTIPGDNSGTMLRRFRITTPTILEGKSATGHEYRIQPEEAEGVYTVHGTRAWECERLRVRGRRLRKNDEPGTQRITLEFRSPDPFDTPHLVCDLAERHRPKTPEELFSEVLKDMEALAADGEHEPGPYITVVESHAGQQKEGKA